MAKNPEEEANKLSDEAKKILHALLKIPDGVESQAINRAVDCIALSATLRTMALQRQALQQLQKDDAGG